MGSKCHKPGEIVTKLRQVCVETTLGLGKAGLTDLLKGPIAGGAFAGRLPVRVLVIAPQTMKHLEECP